MQITTRSTLKIITELPALARADLERVAKALGVRALSIIRQRTGAGLDQNREPFKPYSPEYARRRRLSGRDTTPKLQLTGQLLNGLQVLEVDGPRVTIGLGPKTDTVARFRRIRAKSGKKGTRKGTDGSRLQWTLSKLNETIPAVQKAAYVEQHGRRWFGLDHTDDRRALAETARAEVRRYFERQRR